MGYDFVISYKKGKENLVVDALSQKREEDELFEGSLAMISFSMPDWIEEFKTSYEEYSAEMGETINKLQENRAPPKGYQL